ncbi:MAG: V-type ATPase subunit [bacterium]
MAEYNYGAGQVRALEAKMLTAAQLERMAQAADFAAAIAVLQETVYAENFSRIQQAFDFEELVKLELASLKNLMGRLVPEEALFNEQSPLIKNILTAKRDLANIKNLLRTQALKKPLKEHLTEPGTIGHDILLALQDRSIEDIISRLSFTVYFPFITPGLEHFQKHKSFSLLEKLMDDFVMGLVRQAKYLSSGLEPLVGFYLAKLLEIETLRFILICKKNHVDTEQIKKRVRLSYA